jgi:hypothetical protein
MPCSIDQENINSPYKAITLYSLVSFISYIKNISIVEIKINLALANYVSVVADWQFYLHIIANSPFVSVFTFFQNTESLSPVQNCT